MSGSATPAWQAPSSKHLPRKTPHKTPLPAHYGTRPARGENWLTISNLRLSKGLTGAQLAHALQISDQHLEDLRRGTRHPHRHTVMLIWALSRYPGLLEDLLHIADVRDRHGRRLSKRAEDAVMAGWDDCAPRIKRAASRKKAKSEPPASP